MFRKSPYAVRKGSYTVREAAEILNANAYTIRKLLRQGRLRGFKLTNHWRIKSEDLERFMRGGQNDTGEHHEGQ